MAMQPQHRNTVVRAFEASTKLRNGYNPNILSEQTCFDGDMVKVKVKVYGIGLVQKDLEPKFLPSRISSGHVP